MDTRHGGLLRFKFYFVFITLTLDGTGKILIKVSHWQNLIRNCTISVFFQSMKNFHFALCWGAFTQYGHKYFCGLAALCFFLFFVLLSIREDNLSFKWRNALLLNTGRLCLINFVTINLLGGFLWFFLGKKVKAFIRANTKYAN